MRSAIYMFVMLFALSVCQVAAAVDDFVDEARELFKEGGDRFLAADYDNALEAFGKAYELRPNWKLLYNIGQCHAVLKQYGLAIEVFELYLADGGDDVVQDRRDEVLSEIRRLRDMVGSIEISAQDGLSVYVDDNFRGETPLLSPIRVAAGKKHVVSIRDGEEEIHKRALIVGGTQTATVEVEEPGSSAEQEEPDVKPVEDDDSGKLRPTLFWVGIGTTAAFGAGALAMNFVAKSKIEDIEADPSNKDNKDSGKAIQATGIAFLALTGAAAIATGIIAGFTDFRSEDDSSTDSASLTAVPWVGPSGGGVGIGGTF